jgi:hypothetical protein
VLSGGIQPVRTALRVLALEHLHDGPSPHSSRPFTQLQSSIVAKTPENREARTYRITPRRQTHIAPNSPREQLRGILSPLPPSIRSPTKSTDVLAVKGARFAPATAAALDRWARLRGLDRAMDGSAGTRCSSHLLRRENHVAQARRRTAAAGHKRDHRQLQAFLAKAIPPSPSGEKSS